MDVHNLRSKNTSPEMQVRKVLHARGFRFRLNVKTLPGTPDIVLAKYQAVIFINGCFWHGHCCSLFKIPRTRIQFWTAKIENNAQRDNIVKDRLLVVGWRVAIVWECALKGRNKFSTDMLISKLESWLVDIRCSTIELKGVEKSVSIFI